MGFCRLSCKGTLCLAVLLIGQIWAQAQELPQSSIECFEEHGDPRFSDQRVCIFHNLLLHNNTILFVGDGEAELPQIRIGWEKIYEGDDLLQVQVVRPEALRARLGGAPLVEVDEAGLFAQQHLSNFYHLFAEIAPTIHYTICKYLGRCKYQRHDRLRLFWAQQKRPELPASMHYALPPGIQDLYRCLSPHPVLNVYDATVLEGQALLLRTAVAGLPRRARYYHQKKAEWQERWQDPPPLEHMRGFRQRVAACLGYNFVDAVAPTEPLRITLINRHYDEGRHILNADRLRRQIAALPAVRALGAGRAEVNVVYLEGSLREQAEVVWNSSIFLWPHGAAMAHTLFLPRGAQALEVVQWVVDDPSDQHIWVQGIQRAFQLPIGLDVLVNTDRSKVFFKYDLLMREGSQFHKFNDTERWRLLERWECPFWRTQERGIDGMECFRWFHWGMVTVLDFDLLSPKLEVALVRLQAAVDVLSGRRMDDGSVF